MGGQNQRRDAVTVSDAHEEREHARVVNGRLWVDAVSVGGVVVINDDPVVTSTTLSNVSTTYNNTTTSANSQTIDCSNHRKFILLLTLAHANAPTDIQFIIQFSNDGGTTWFDYRDWFWGQLLYDDIAAAFSRSWMGDCVGDFMRLRVVASGTTASATFTVTGATIILKN